MAVNKVEVNGETVLDLSQDSVTPEQLAQGATAHNAAGEQITGTYTAPVTSVNGQTGDVDVKAVLYEQQTLTDAQKQQARENIGVVQPDWQQNDETAPDYVKNRPGGYDGYDIITWDGNLTGKPFTADGANCFVKVSNKLPSKSELLGGTLVYVDRQRAEEDVITISIDESQMAEMDGMLLLNEVAVIVYNPPVSLESFSFTEAGVWFGGTQKPDSSDAVAFTRSLQTAFLPVKIPQKYLDLDSKADRPSTTTATLLASDWTGDSAPYSYTLAVAGVTADSNQEYLPALGITTEQLAALQAANIQDGGQQPGTVTLKAFGTKPAIDLPIRVLH